ncbi:MAG TPA: efflux transporter outer membrane subunit [Vitreimonas sp.]|uniref:TolC family protein n=1 Tax=Vitreimonas sp. TaxID=3069702 RepID=UPI002D2C6B12|nr:efflux transporter outer membrane subunit [Vitreimonas sp.]HYD88912.1 efflux transporter outer membrane subunit [Vitreimonas sp.]
MKYGVRLWIGLGLMAAAGSCAGRNLPPEPDSYVAADAIGAERAAELAASPAATWLDDMNSPEMSTLAREALAGSPDLQIVEAQYRAARWRARGSFGSNLLPSLEIGVDGTREEEPTPGSDERVRTEFMTSSVIARWEIDLWGRLASRALASDLNADAAEEDLNGARLSVAGQTSRAWVDLIEAQQLLALAQEDLQTRERALDLTQRRYDAGIATSLALRTARSQVASARAFEAQAQDSLLIASRRLQELMGRYPDGTLRAEGQLPQLAPLAAAGAPADLLERRPDVLASENRMRAAGFRMHEARAAMLPRLTLTGTAGNSGQGINDIDDSANMVSNLIAGITMPIFNGGALFSESRATVADRRAAAADYVRTSIAAWREVEGTISADQSLEVRETQFAIAADEAREAQALAEREYARGVATLFELIDAYTRRIDAERGLIQARAARVSNRITYHVALGGGARTGGIDEDRELAP